MRSLHPRPCAHSGHAMMRRPRRCLSQNAMEQLVLTEPVLSDKGRGTEDEVRAARTYSTSYNVQVQLDFSRSVRTEYS